MNNIKLKTLKDGIKFESNSKGLKDKEVMMQL